MHLCICCFVLCYLPKLKSGMALVFSAIVFYKDIKKREEGIMLIIACICCFAQFTKIKKRYGRFSVYFFHKNVPS